MYRAIKLAEPRSMYRHILGKTLLPKSFRDRHETELWALPTVQYYREGERILKHQI
jgi:hypothetical protein